MNIILLNDVATSLRRTISYLGSQKKYISYLGPQERRKTQNLTQKEDPPHSYIQRSYIQKNNAQIMLMSCGRKKHHVMAVANLKIS